MPNQLNYPILLDSTKLQRPERITQIDKNLLQEGTKSIVFGTNTRDVVEIWIYNPDGSFAGHITLPYNDPALTLQTIVDDTESALSIETLNIDFKNVLNRVSIFPGRYAIVVNFFRDEVGSESGYKMFISDISDDRLTIKLSAVESTLQVKTDILEFVVPSVPRTVAKGLIDEIFGKELSGDANSQVTLGMITNYLNTILPLSARVNYSDSQAAYIALINNILDSAYIFSVFFLGADAKNEEVQYGELISYITDAVNLSINTIVSNKQVDNRFSIG